MAHFAKIGLNNKVISVHSVHNNELLDADGVEQEVNGIRFLTNLHGWSIWKQTSFNTYGGVHNNGGTPFRKNFAGVGYTYDEDRNAFIPPKPKNINGVVFNSWTLNENTCIWQAPIPEPTLTQEQIDNNNYYRWNEENQTWDLV